MHITALLITAMLVVMNQSTVAAATAAAGEVEKSKMVTSHRRGDYPFLL